MSFTEYKSPVTRARKLRLSVLVPFFRDDPSPLLHDLSLQAAELSGVEIIFYDDGTDDTALTETLRSKINAASVNLRLLSAPENHGRAFARNTLQDQARAEWVLFLDADMRPESSTFLNDYLTLISQDTADIIFGGFTVARRADHADQELHRRLSEVSDCLPLKERQAAGPQFVATSNLCVKKSVLQAEKFDPDFHGWGWEDSEWAARVSDKYRLLHADIPACHLGLESTDTLLRRFKDSAQNYVLFTRKHPALAQSLSLYRLSQSLRKLPGQKLMRPVLKALVKFKLTPMRLRVLALKLWRASWYAEAFA